MKNQTNSRFRPATIARLVMALTFTCVGAFTGQAQDIISLNICSPQNSSQDFLDAGDYAGAPDVRTNNWNNLVADNNWSSDEIALSSGSVIDSAGNVVSDMSVTFHPAGNGGGVGTYSSGGNANDVKLFKDYNDAFNCSGFSQYGYLDITGIPYTSYQIYCYASTSDTPGGPVTTTARGGFFVITNAPGGAARCYVRTVDNNGNLEPVPDSSGDGYVQSTTTSIPPGGTSFANISGGNYVVFNVVLTNSSARIWFGALGDGQGVDDLGNTVTDGQGAARLKVAGFQIVNSPVLPPLTVGITPTISTVLGGSAVTFTAVPLGGSGVYTYQWYQAGVGSLAGQTNLTLVLSDVTTNMSGSSYYVAVNDGSTTVDSGNALLTVASNQLGQVADIISFDLVSPTSQNALEPGDYAGAPGVRTNNWNNLVADANNSEDNISLPAGSVLDAAGNSVGIMSVTFHPVSTGGGVVNYGSTGSGNDAKLFSDYDDAFGGDTFGNFGYIDIANIPFTSYQVYCYYEPDNSVPRGGFLLITNAPGGSVRCYIQSTDNNGNQEPTPDANGNNYIQSTTTSIPSGATWADIDGGNYVVFNSLLTNSSTRVWFGAIGNGTGSGNSQGSDDLGKYPTGGDSIVRFKLCGFQIVRSSVPPLSATITPINTAVVAGTTVTFTATPWGGSGVYTYQWYQAGVGSLAGQTNLTLVLVDVTTNMSGNLYYVAVSDGHTTVDSGNASLTVSGPQFGQVFFDSFEPPVCEDLTSASANGGAGWDLASGNIDWNVTGFSGGAFLELAGYAGFATSQPGITGVNDQIILGSGAGSFTKNLGISFQPNTTYTVDVAGGSATEDMTFGLQSSVSGSLPGATVGLIHEASLASGEFVYASTLPSNEGNVFTFTTSSAVPSGQIVAYISATGSGYIYADSFTVTTTQVVPQPLSATITPTNTTVVAGSTVTFIALPSGGTGNYTYQWYQAGLGSLSGQTQSTLMLSGVTNTSSYYVAVYDGNTTVQSVNDMLTVTPSLAQVLNAPYAPGLPVDANPAHWSGLGATQVYMDTSELNTYRPGNLGLTIQYAWDYTNLYILVRENTNLVTAASQQEAPDEPTYQANPWSFDTIAFWIDLENTAGTTDNGTLVVKDNADFQPWFGFSSLDLTNLFYGRANESGNIDLAGLAHAKIATSGDFSDHNRVIEAAISWADVAADVATSLQPGGNLVAAVKPGYKFGCEPLEIYNDYNTQCFMGGTNNPNNPWNPPSGVDSNSVDVLLMPPVLPVLSVQLESGQVVVRWPASASSFNLYTSPVLGSGAAWTRVTSPAPVVDPNDPTKMKWVTPVTGATKAFYRLQ